MEEETEMFPASASYEHAHILEGETPRRMISSLKRIFDLSLQNSLVTYLTGDPGSGKSHVVNHIKHMHSNMERRIVIIIKANDFAPREGLELNEESILKSIIQDPEFRDLAKAVSVDLDNNEVDANHLAAMINLVTHRKTKERLNSEDPDSRPFGVTIAIDGLDEYVKPLRNMAIIQSATKQFAITVRLLLDRLEKSCFLLSMTHDILTEVLKIIKPDRTFLRRFIVPQEYDGTELRFSEFTYPETCRMHDDFVENWLEKHNSTQANDGSNGICVSTSSWPLSRSAIQLVHECSDKTPRALQRLFQIGLVHLKKTHPSDWLSSAYSVGLEEMARLISVAYEDKMPGLDLREHFVHKVYVLSRIPSYFSTDLDASSEDSAIFLGTFLEKEGYLCDVRKVAGSSFSGDLSIIDIETSGEFGADEASIGVIHVNSHGVDSSQRSQLNELVSAKEIRRLLIIAPPGEIDWVYYPSRNPVDYEGAHKRHLGKCSQVLQIDSIDLAKVSQSISHLSSPDFDTLAWYLDQSIQPCGIMTLSEVICSIARSALGAQ